MRTLCTSSCIISKTWDFILELLVDIGVQDSILDLTVPSVAD